MRIQCGILQSLGIFRLLGVFRDFLIKPIAKNVMQNHPRGQAPKTVRKNRIPKFVIFNYLKMTQFES